MHGQNEHSANPYDHRVDNPDFPALQTVRLVIEDLRRRWCLLAVARIGLAWVVALATVTLILSLIAAVAEPGSVGRGLLVSLWIVGFCAGPAAIGFVLWRGQPGDVALARIAEDRAGLEHNCLTNALQISQQPFWSKGLVNRLVRESAGAVRDFDYRNALPIRDLRRIGTMSMAALAVALVAALLGWPTVSYGFSRLYCGSYASFSGRYRILSVEPGDAVVVAHRPVRIVARFEGPPQAPEAQVVVETSEGETTETLAIDGTSASAAIFVREETEYRVRVGDALSDRHRLQVVDPKDVVSVSVALRFPAYLGLRDTPPTDCPGPLEAPEGTRITLIVRPKADPQGLQVELKSGQVLDLQEDASPGQLMVQLTAERDDEYRLAGDFAGSQLYWPTEGGYFPLKVAIDQPPTVRAIDPTPATQLPAGSAVTFTGRAEDDHGLARIRLLVRLPDGTELEPAAQEPNAAKAMLTCEWRLPEQLEAGQVVEWWFEAADHRKLPDRGPQSGASPVGRIEIISAEGARVREQTAQTFLERVAALRERQIKVRTETLRVDVGQGAIAAVIEGQGTIHSELTALAASELSLDLSAAKRILERLAADESVRAVELAEAGRTAELSTVQKRIVLALESILKAAESPEEQETPASGPAATMPARTFADLSELLGEFIDAERQAIREAQNLTGKSPEDFTAVDEAKLAELSQEQERWEEFLQQALDDLAKQIEQDFSSGSLRPELVEIQSQVQVAEEALKKKSVRMAIEAELVGLELAEELVHNIERWLPDGPDRIQWEMTEPPAPIDVPLAELPEELQDIIGELIEEEEDLYDEIEDATSTWADSLDMGVGWDAVDGPISNYSAKGVTGNTLPNRHEIWGRSGEGRTGRSSGEFVEQEATGKGGRRTPTRLTPDAFQEGQIKDSSTDPAGGATGGGKLSGAGAEGLTGPGPQKQIPDLPALRNKQASLLTKTELTQQQAVRKNWGNFQLDEVVNLMRANLSDLDRRAYRNVLARREVLVGSLENSRTLLAGRFQLDRTDGTAEKLLESHLKGADRTTWPTDHASLIQRYYELLGSSSSDEP